MPREGSLLPWPLRWPDGSDDRRVCHDRQGERAQARRRPPGGGSERAGGRLRPTAPSAGRQRAVQRGAGGELDQRMSRDRRRRRARPIPPRRRRRRLREHAQVAYVEPNYVIQRLEAPERQRLRRAVGAAQHRPASAARPAPTSARPLAWDVTTGGGVTVAVVDTGIDYNHPDLDGNIWHNPSEPVNGVDDDGDGFVDDVHGADFVNRDTNPNDDAGHGTHVGGIIGAEGNNGDRRHAASTGTRSLMPLKFLDDNGEGNTADAAMAIDYAVAHGARVINASWGGPPSARRSTRRCAAPASTTCWWSRRPATRATTPTSRPTTRRPSTSPNVISVAASDRYDQLLVLLELRRQVGRPRRTRATTSTRPCRPASTRAATRTSAARRWRRPSVSGRRGPLPLASARRLRPTRSATRCSRASTPATSSPARPVSGGRLDVAKALGAHPRLDEPERDNDGSLRRSRC